MLRTQGLETGLITTLINEIIIPKCMLGTKKHERTSKKPTTEKASKKSFNQSKSKYNCIVTTGPLMTLRRGFMI